MVGRVALGDVSNNFGQVEPRKVADKAVVGGKKGFEEQKENNNIGQKSRLQNVELSRGRRMVALGRRMLGGPVLGEVETGRRVDRHLLQVPRVGVEEITIDDDDECMEVEVEENNSNDFEYSGSIFAHLKSTERSTVVNKKHPPHVRRTLVDWLREVQDDWEEINIDTLFLAVNLLDRYLATKQGAGTSTSNLQLVGVTALLVACKVEEVNVPEVAQFAWVTDDTYSARQIKAMEQRMLEALNWNVTPVLSTNFLSLVFRNLEVDDPEHAERALGHLKQGLLDPEVSSMLPSLQAGAAIYLSTHPSTGPILARVANACRCQSIEVLAAAQKMRRNTSQP